MRTAAVLAVLLLGLAHGAAGQDLSASTPSLTGSSAAYLLEAAKTAAMDQGKPPMAVVVVDTTGEVVSSTAMDGVPPGIASIVAVRSSASCRQLFAHAGPLHTLASN